MFDLSSDPGESFGTSSMGDDAAVLDVASIAIRSFARSVWK